MLKAYALSPIKGQKVDPCLMFQNQNSPSCIIQLWLPELILITGIVVIVIFVTLILVRKLFSRKSK